MSHKFEKSKVIGATRRILYEIAIWTENLFDAGAPKRLIGERATQDGLTDQDWEAPGIAGSVIERSMIVSHIGRVIDCLNSNKWHGDPRNLYLTYRELTPLHILLEKADAISAPDDYSIHTESVSVVLQVLEIFFARVTLELDYGELELKQLAAIAGLAEKTVRMAAIGRDKNPDLVTFKSGARTYVEAKEALRWLTKKNADYQPIDWASDQFLPPVDPKNIQELGPYIRELREKSGMTFEDIALRLGWGNETTSAYQALESGGDSPLITKLRFDELIQFCKVVCPAESAELMRIIDRVLHPLFLEKLISEEFPGSAGQ